MSLQPKKRNLDPKMIQSWNRLRYKNFERFIIRITITDSLLFQIEEIKEGTTRWSLEDPKNADGRKASRKSKDDPQKPRGSKPLESEEAALLRKSKDDGKGPAPSEEEKAEEEEELPLGEEGMLAFAYVYAGESAMDTNVETSIWQAPDEMLGEDWIAPLTYDKATQVSIKIMCNSN